MKGSPAFDKFACSSNFFLTFLNTLFFFIRIWFMDLGSQLIQISLFQPQEDLSFWTFPRLMTYYFFRFSEAYFTTIKNKNNIYMYLKISNCPVHHFPPKIDKTIVLKLSIVWFLIMYNTYTLIVFNFFPNSQAYLNFDLISVSASYKTPCYKKSA